MIKTFVQNIGKINHTNKTNNTKQDKKILPEQYTITNYAALLGGSVGLVDGFATLYCAKKDLKTTLNLFKKASFADKRLMVKNLLENGKTVNDFKKYTNTIFNKSIPKAMLKRGIIYGSIGAVAGFAADIYKKNINIHNKK